MPCKSSFYRVLFLGIGKYGGKILVIGSILCPAIF